MAFRKAATPVKVAAASKKPAKAAEPAKKPALSDEVSPAATVTTAHKRATPKSLAAKPAVKAEEPKVIC